MRKLLFICLLITLFSCEKNDTIDLLPTVNVDVTINLRLAEFIELQTPTGWVYTASGNDGIKGIWLQYTGGTPAYKAFERACPNNDCSAPMTFDGSLKLKCSCDASEYSIIDGAPQTAGNSQYAREYRVIKQGDLIRITNF